MRKVRNITSIVLVVVVIYTGWIFYSRWKERHELLREEHQREAENARFAVQEYGGDRVKILNISISPPEVSNGQHATLCYGVSNAKTVKIEPAPDEEIWPSMSRCVKVTAHADTTFKLTAQDAAGNVQTAVVPLKVR